MTVLVMIVFMVGLAVLFGGGMALAAYLVAAAADYAYRQMKASYLFVEWFLQRGKQPRWRNHPTYTGLWWYADGIFGPNVAEVRFREDGTVSVYRVGEKCAASLRDYQGYKWRAIPIPPQPEALGNSGTSQ